MHPRASALTDHQRTGAAVLSAIEVLLPPAPAEVAGARPVRFKSLQRMEWDYIQLVLASCGGNKSEAARSLGLHRSVLQRKLRRLPPRW